ncbi:MAG: hypothetical protein JSS32_05895 [Verrucomicrobia bacterium]|nr:hypothetical protein [Verrucomicrobiota bacterium]
MKKFTVLLAVLATVSGSAVHAQNAGGNAARGAGANAGKTMGSDAFAWGACIGSLAVLGTVVGLAASAGASSPATFGH